MHKIVNENTHVFMVMGTLMAISFFLLCLPIWLYQVGNDFLKHYGTNIFHVVTSWLKGIQNWINAGLQHGVYGGMPRMFIVMLACLFTLTVIVTAIQCISYAIKHRHTKKE